MDQGTLKKLAQVVAGGAVSALSSALFILPYRLVTGGVAGLALLLSPLGLPAARIIPLLTWSLFLLGWCTLGHRFASRTFLFSLSYPLFLSFFSSLYGKAGVPLLFGSGPWGAPLAALMGGTVLGLGCAFSFRGGGSTGGLDVIALLLCRVLPRLRVGRVIFLLDTLICLGGLLLFQSPLHSLLGALAAFMGAVMLELFYPLSAGDRP